MHWAAQQLLTHSLAVSMPGQGLLLLPELLPMRLLRWLWGRIRWTGLPWVVFLDGCENKWWIFFRTFSWWNITYVISPNIKIVNSWRNSSSGLWHEIRWTFDITLYKRQFWLGEKECPFDIIARMPRRICVVKHRDIGCRTEIFLLSDFVNSFLWM